LQKARWYPVRLVFKGNSITVQVNDTQVHALHAIFGNQETTLNFLVFGDSAGFRNVKLVR
jgi:arylsulfatase A